MVTGLIRPKLINNYLYRVRKLPEEIFNPFLHWNLFILCQLISQLYIAAAERNRQTDIASPLIDTSD